MHIQVLWGMGYNLFEQQKNDFLKMFSGEGDSVNFVEKYNKRGLIAELKNPSVKGNYGIVIINESVENTPFEVTQLEEIVDSCSDTDTVLIFCLSNSHKGGSYTQTLLNIGIYNCIYMNDLTGAKLYGLYKRPRKRREAKMYLGIDDRSQGEAGLVDNSIVTRIIYNLTREKEDEKRIELFRHIMSQYAEEEILYIIGFFPEDLLGSLKSEPLVTAFLNTQNPKSSARGLLSGVGNSDVDDEGNVPTRVITKKEVVIKPVQVEKFVKFRKLVYTIFGCPEFASEFAYAIANKASTEVMLINLDFVSPKIDSYLNLSEYFEDALDRNLIFENLLKAANNDSLSRSMLEDSAIKKTDNLYVLMSGYYPVNYENFKEFNIRKLIEKSYQHFEMTVVCTRGTLTDWYTIEALKQSHINILPVSPYMTEVNEYNRYLEIIKNKYGIPFDKNKIVAFEYKDGISLPVSKMKEIWGDCYLGKISYCEDRERYRNLNAVYAQRIRGVNDTEYNDLLHYFNLVSKQKLKERIKNFFITKETNKRRAKATNSAKG